jgi:hypothetical protein
VIVHTVFGVDFSGAKLAGANTWVARAEVNDTGLSLVALDPLEALAGTPEREPALGFLLEAILASTDALWGIDFPFGLPVELFPAGMPWDEQLPWLESFAGDAVACGRDCVRRALKTGGPMHIRRTTDIETKTPFDCYHYRIIHQTYHGMTKMLARLHGRPRTAILPFDSLKSKTSRVVVETCPSSTLKRLRLPYRNYKQPTGGPLTTRVMATRTAILAGIEPRIAISESHRRVAMRNPGGDALDAIVAAVGTFDSFLATDLRAVARHPRYRFEGRIYA